MALGALRPLEDGRAAGRTIATKTPEMLAEVAVPAKELDGAVDATLTTGWSVAPDRGRSTSPGADRR